VDSKLNNSERNEKVLLIGKEYKSQLCDSRHFESVKSFAKMASILWQEATIIA